MTRYTIGQLASAAGVATSTVRFYERRGLIVPDDRTDANYRTYSERSLERLKFIRAAQASGFSLKDVRDMLALIHSDDSPCADVAAVIEHRLKEVREKLRELRRVERALVRAHDSCCTGEPDFCTQIQRLKGDTSPCLPPPRGKSSRRLLTLH